MPFSYSIEAMARRNVSFLAATFALVGMIGTLHAQQTKPNILVIWGDDIGTWNISHNNRGMMGYQTPNIDRIAKRRCLASPITTLSKVARQGALRSSAAACRCARA